MQSARADTGSSATDPTELSITLLGQMLERREISSRELVDFYLGRIAQYDGSLRSLIEVNPNARELADELDNERQQGAVRGGLHGIPIVLKDNINTADAMSTTAGSLALEGSKPSHDAEVARRLRAAGAVFLGKANMSEWANFRAARSVSGWSARGGQCRNPYSLERSPSGSSSGSAVATAANLCAAAVGTETDGSIVSPAHSCGVVGVKPTVGLVSRQGVIPIAGSQDTVGPIARTVDDAAALLAAMAGPDVADPVTTRNPGLSIVSPVPQRDGPSLRLGIARTGVLGSDSRVDALFDSAVEELRHNGAQFVEDVDLPLATDYRQSDILLFEFGRGMRAYLDSLGQSAPVKSLDEIIAFNVDHPSEELRWFGQDLLIAAARQPSRPPRRYLAAKARVRATAERIVRVFEKHRLDALVAPTSLPVWLIDSVNGDCQPSGSWSICAGPGFPQVTVPGGFVGGLPVGISFFAPAWKDQALLEVAKTFESLTQHRRPPSLCMGGAAL